MEGDFVMGMGEDEIMQRAREAVIKVGDYNESDKAAIRSGEYCLWMNVAPAAQAVRDYHRPLSEIVPVNPDLLMAREVCAEAFEKIGSASVADDYRSGKYDEGDLEISIALAMATRIRAEMAK
jgi:hypothetical protein